MARSIFPVALPPPVCMAILPVCMALVFGLACGEEPASSLSRLDPTSWGSDHVGKSMPDYVTGDECLFCHRDVGPTWPTNRHTLTVRLASDKDLAAVGDISAELADSVSHVMGRRRVTRFLKRSAQYGKLELLTGKLRHHDETLAPKSEAWQAHTFADRCAGCHATAVDTKTKAFSAIAIDCVACHGSVDLAHTKTPGLVLLSKQNRQPREVISICGQCHLRGGESASSGLPWPNTFVAGDNLFRDFKVDFRDQAIDKRNPIDRHVFENVRDVALHGKTDTTCLTCHDVHGGTSDKHQALNDSQRCQTCHVAGTDNTELTDQFSTARGPRGHSQVCDY